MTMAEDRARSAARPYGYDVPGNLTKVAEHAFRTEVRAFAAELVNQTERVAHEAHRADPECTADDVQAARRRIGRALTGDVTDQGVVAASLLTVATVGVSVTANFLRSPLQVAVFGVFVVCGLVGLLLTWTGRSGR